MGKRDRKKTKSGQSGQRPERTNYSLIERHNERYESYYNGLNIVPEEERQKFWDALRRDLPSSFRFTGSKSHALAVQERLKDHYIPKITSITYEGNLVEPPRPIPWYPDQLAWSMTTPKNVVRRFPPFAAFQKFLVAETEVGNISRQEVVSMIPPLLMDVRPGMTVLDMCAAPGSKSCQLMEMVHAGEEERMQKVMEAVEAAEELRQKGNLDVPRVLGEGMAGFDDDGRTTGLLIANDSDYKRAHMLIHQMKRLNSPNLIVTNHDATLYPSIRLLPAQDKGDKQSTYLKFDRILADVPCSGDGTSRKNVRVWKDWTPGNGIGLHPIQYRILLRALQMLKVGGRVVYSTCSLNPVENEAVVASVVKQCGGSDKVRIVDTSNELPGLKRVPGLTTWDVMDKSGKRWASWADVLAEIRAGNSDLAKIAPSMFPPTDVVEGDADLRRCMRVYPHFQDTGGFFIAVLEKKGEVRVKLDSKRVVLQRNADNQSANQAGDTQATSSDAMAQDASVYVDAAPPSPSKRATSDENGEHTDKRIKVDAPVGEVAGEPQTESKAPDGTAAAECIATQSTAKDDTVPEGATQESTERGRPAKEDTAESAVVKPAKRKEGSYEEPFRFISADHPEFKEVFGFYDISSQFPRDRFMVRNVEGRPVRTVYYTSQLARDILTTNEGTGLKFVHCGVKMFVKQDVQSPETCPWRVQKDGLQLINPWMGPRRVVRLRRRETLRNLLVEMFPRADAGGSEGTTPELGEIGQFARDIGMGCCVLRVEPDGTEEGLGEHMVLPLWRSRHSLNLMLPKEERKAMLLRLFDDDTPLINTTYKREMERASS